MKKITQFRLAEKGVQFSCNTKVKICNKSAITNGFNTKEDKCNLLWWVLALKKVRKSYRIKVHGKKQSAS